MTGMYVRVFRHGEWQNREIDTLTNEELNALAADQPDKGWTWAIALAKWIDEHVTDYLEDENDDEDDDDDDDEEEEAATS